MSRPGGHFFEELFYRNERRQDHGQTARGRYMGATVYSCYTATFGTKAPLAIQRNGVTAIVYKMYMTSPDDVFVLLRRLSANNVLK